MAATSVNRLAYLHGDSIDYPQLSNLLDFQKQIVLRLFDMENPVTPYKCHVNSVSMNKDIHGLYDIGQTDLMCFTKNGYLIVPDGAGKMTILSRLIRLVKDLTLDEWVRTCNNPVSGSMAMIIRDSYYSNGKQLFFKTPVCMVTPTTLIIAEPNRCDAYMIELKAQSLNVGMYPCDLAHDVVLCTPRHYKTVTSEYHDQNCQPFRVIIDDYSKINLRQPQQIPTRIVWFSGSQYENIPYRGYYKDLQNHTKNEAVYCTIMVLEDEVTTEIQNSLSERTKASCRVETIQVLHGHRSPDYLIQYYRSKRDYARLLLCMGANMTTYREQFNQASNDDILHRLIAHTQEKECSLCYEDKHKSTDGFYPCCQQVTCLKCVNRLMQTAFPITCPFCRTEVIPSVLNKVTTEPFEHQITSLECINGLLDRHRNERVLIVCSRDDDCEAIVDSAFVIQSISHWKQVQKLTEPVVCVTNDVVHCGLGSLFDTIIICPKVERLLIKKIKGLLYFSPFSSCENKCMYVLVDQ